MSSKGRGVDSDMWICGVTEIGVVFNAIKEITRFALTRDNVCLQNLSSLDSWKRSSVSTLMETDPNHP